MKSSRPEFFSTRRSKVLILPRKQGFRCKINPKKHATDKHSSLFCPAVSNKLVKNNITTQINVCG
jgi:hypothetical protein